jgi:hypothetical protein
MRETSTPSQIDFNGEMYAIPAIQILRYKDGLSEPHISSRRMDEGVLRVSEMSGVQC